MVVESLRVSSVLSDLCYTPIHDEKENGIKEGSGNILNTPTHSSDQLLKYHNHWQEDLRRRNYHQVTKCLSPSKASPLSRGMITLRRINLLKTFNKHISAVSTSDAYSSREDDMSYNLQISMEACRLLTQNKATDCKDVDNNVSVLINKQPLRAERQNVLERRIPTFISCQEYSEISHSVEVGWERNPDQQVHTCGYAKRLKHAAAEMDLQKCCSDQLFNQQRSEKNISSGNIFEKNLIADASKVVPKIETVCEDFLEVSDLTKVHFVGNRLDDKDHVHKVLDNVAVVIKQERENLQEAPSETHVTEPSRLNCAQVTPQKSYACKVSLSPVSVSTFIPLENFQTSESSQKVSAPAEHKLKQDKHMRGVLAKNKEQKFTISSSVCKADAANVKLKSIREECLEETLVYSSELSHNKKYQQSRRNKLETGDTKTDTKMAQSVVISSLNSDCVTEASGPRMTRMKRQVEQRCLSKDSDIAHSTICFERKMKTRSSTVRRSKPAAVTEVELENNYSEKSKNILSSVLNTCTDEGKKKLTKKILIEKPNDSYSDHALALKVEKSVTPTEEISGKGTVLRKKHDKASKLQELPDYGKGNYGVPDTPEVEIVKQAQGGTKDNGLAEVADPAQVGVQGSDAAEEAKKSRKHRKKIQKNILEVKSLTVHKNEITVSNSSQRIEKYNKKISSVDTSVNSLMPGNTSVNKPVIERKFSTSVARQSVIRSTSQKNSSHKISQPAAVVDSDKKQIKKIAGKYCLSDDAQNSHVFTFADPRRTSRNAVSKCCTNTIQSLELPVFSADSENTEGKHQDLALHEMSSTKYCEVRDLTDLCSTSPLQSSVSEVTDFRIHEQKPAAAHSKIEMPLVAKAKSRKKRSPDTSDGVSDNFIGKAPKIKGDTEDVTAPCRNLRKRKTYPDVIKDPEDERSSLRTSVITRERIKSVKKEKIKMDNCTVQAEKVPRHSKAKKEIGSQASNDNRNIKENKVTRRQKTIAAKNSIKNKTHNTDDEPLKTKKKIETSEQETGSSTKRTTQKFVGAHCSIAGGVSNAVTEAVSLGARAFGLFVRNGRTWKLNPLDTVEAEKFKAACREHGFLPHLILPHGSYLLNCGSTDPQILQKSRDTLIHELKLCEMLGLSLYNFHPGSACGKGSVDECIQIIAESINLAHQKTRSVKTVIENMSCQGNTVGGKFEELRAIIDSVKDKSRVGVCLDTCHAFAAGFDLSSKTGFNKCLEDFDRIVGLQYLCAVHLNDSKGEVGCHLDRHANIGKGMIGIEGFRHVMNDPRLNNIPMILETPVNDYAKEIQLLCELEKLSDV